MLWGMKILLKFQLPSFNDLEEKDDLLTESINEWIIDKVVCRTAPATTGLLTILLKQ